MSTTPVLCDGAVAVIDESPLMVKLVAAVVPNFTAVAPEKFVPVIVRTWPPVEAPLLGLTAVTAGAGAVMLLKV